MRLAALGALWTLAVAAVTADEEPWNVVSRSTNAVRTSQGARVFSFVDSVVITHGELVATSDEARYLEDVRRALLRGHVVMNHDSTTVRGPTAYYDRNTAVARFAEGAVIERPTATAIADEAVWRRAEDRFELHGNVAAADTSGTLDGDAMTYDTARDMFFVAGNARFVDDVSGVIVEGDHLEYDQKAARAKATGAPRAVFDDEDGVPVHVTSQLLIYDPKRDIADALGDVVIHRETLEATADSASFERTIDRVRLWGSPELVDGSTVIRGDRIELLGTGPGSRTVTVRGNAQVSNRFAVADRTRPVPAPEGLPEEDSAPLGDSRSELESAATTILEKEPSDSSAAAVESLAAPPDTSAIVAPDSLVTAAIAETEDALAEAGETAAADTSTAADEAVSDEEEEEDERPEWLKVPGDRLPAENLLFGEEIQIFFVENDIDRVDVVGFGRSKFYPNEATGDLTEWNDVTGDTLHVWFAGTAVESVTVLGNGSGEYRLPSESIGAVSAEELKREGKLVRYQAPVIRYDRTNEMMHLDRGAEVQFKDMVLRSGTIDFDARRETMAASGDPTPTLIDAEDVIVGHEMNYHLPTQKGEIVDARTQFDSAYYHGDDIWKMGDDVLAVEGATYTTCSLEKPHYHFQCKHMKIYLDDKMVARPVVFRIRNIPVLALPFYMTSLKKNRHSGFLLPNLELGVDSNRGRFVRNVGYYWAPNDYWDVTSTFDFFPQQERIVSHLNTRYALRYRYSGALSLTYNRDVPLDRKETAVAFRHDHEFSETSRLTADARFVSSSSIYQNIDDEDQRLNRDLQSHATYTRRFDGNRNLRVDFRRNENLDTGSINETLPTLQLSQPSSPITGARSSSDPNQEPRWLDDIYYDAGLVGVHQHTKSATGVDERHIGSTADFGLRTTQSLPFVRFSPSLDGEATWIDEDREGRRNATRATYGASLSALTDVYGTFLVPVGPARGFRHKMSPNVTWSWSPDFDEYFFTDEDGARRDRFVAFGGVRGTRGRTNSMRLSVGNLLQTKAEIAGQERRYDLFSFNNSLSYDFLAEERGDRPLSNLSSSLTVLSSSLVNQTWSATHDPYTWNLLGSSVTTSMRLRSTMFERRAEAANGDAAAADTSASSDTTSTGVPGLEPEQYVGRFTPGQWTMDLSHTSRRGSVSGSTSSNLVLRSSWSPTDKWNVQFDAGYDLKNGDNTNQKWVVQRIIHCWDLSFSRQLLGGEWQYYFRINVTGLPDIQAERGDRGLGGVTGSSTFSDLPGF